MPWPSRSYGARGVTVPQPRASASGAPQFQVAYSLCASLNWATVRPKSLPAAAAGLDSPSRARQPGLLSGGRRAGGLL